MRNFCWSTLAAGLTSACLLAVLMSQPATAAQYIATHRAVYQPAYFSTGVPRTSANWHHDMVNVGDLDLNHDAIFSLLHDFTLPEHCTCQPYITVKEQLETDHNQTSHIYISVQRRDECSGEAAVALTDFNVSVLDKYLTTSANTRHGTFERSYSLPIYALAANSSAVYTGEMLLHIKCPTDVPAPLPRNVHVLVEQPKSKPSSTPTNSGENEWVLYSEPETTATNAVPARLLLHMKGSSHNQTSAGQKPAPGGD